MSKENRAFLKPTLVAAVAVTGGLLAIGMLGSTVRAAGPALTLKSTSIELPGDRNTFPPGPNVDLVSANCPACHSPGMVLTQPLLSKAAWDGEVTKMIKVYKAPVASADVPAIVDYLVAIKGAK